MDIPSTNSRKDADNLANFEQLTNSAKPMLYKHIHIFVGKILASYLLLLFLKLVRLSPEPVPGLCLPRLKIMGTQSLIGKD